MYWPHAGQYAWLLSVAGMIVEVPFWLATVTTELFMPARFVPNQLGCEGVTHRVRRVPETSVVRAYQFVVLAVIRFFAPVRTNDDLG